ncbi:MAG: hypothetical protein ACRC5A_10930 [Enterobacteriaceae bacterium]
MNTIITTESVEANDSLFAKYKILIANPSASRDDFYLFMTTPSDKRELFVEGNAMLETSMVGDIIVVKCKSK